MKLEAILTVLIISFILSFGCAYLLKIALFRITKLRLHYFRAYILVFSLSIINKALVYFFMLPFNEFSFMKNSSRPLIISFLSSFVFTFLLFIALCATVIKNNNGKSLKTSESIYVSLTYVGLKIFMLVFLYAAAVIVNILLCGI